MIGPNRRISALIRCAVVRAASPNAGAVAKSPLSAAAAVLA